MRRRLPASLRWRLLLALVATSAVTLAATALVVLPPLQDRLRSQSAESLEVSVENNRTAVEAELARLGREKVPYDQYRFELFPVANELNAQTNARVLILDETMVPSDPLDSPPGFLYDSEFALVPRRTLQAAIAGFYEPVTTIDGE